jgi:hypothetical protein
MAERRPQSVSNEIRTSQIVLQMRPSLMLNPRIASAVQS